MKTQRRAALLGFFFNTPHICSAAAVSNLNTEPAEFIKPSPDAARRNAVPIFNAVQDAMTQWGSSLHHNGMSFINATVPAGVQLHHGSYARESPRDPDWLAFEIEHAEAFTRVSGVSPRMGPGKGKSGKSEWKSGEDENARSYLHIYRTMRPMYYLYIDGMSAGKTEMGTLDTQDLLLRLQEAPSSVTPSDDSSPPPPFSVSNELRKRGLESGNEGNDEDDNDHRNRRDPMNEFERAVELCKIVRPWGLDGVIRMEAGFEIIHCDFSDGLRQIQALQRPRPSHIPHGHDGDEGEDGKPLPNVYMLEYLRGIAERYQGIGADRVSLDWGSMVSAYFFDLNLTNTVDPTRPDLPRLSGVDEKIRWELREYLSNVMKISSAASSPSQNIDWQGVSSLIVSRYADRLKYMSKETTDLSIIKDEGTFIMTLFVDFEVQEGATVDLAAARDRCVSHYLPPVEGLRREADKLIYAAFHEVMERVCGDLFQVWDLLDLDFDVKTTDAFPAPTFSFTGTSRPLPPTALTKNQMREAGQEKEAKARNIITDLLGYLDWARFKRCSACGIDEVCTVPVWPVGFKSDFAKPSCRNATTVRRDYGGDSYWR